MVGGVKTAKMMSGGGSRIVGLCDSSLSVEV